MKQLLCLGALVAVLAGCSSTPTDTYSKRAEYERERQEKLADRAIDKAPKWMTELPKSPSAVYSAGTATSPDFAMADEKAKVIAYGKVCMSAGGEVDKSSRVFRNDVGDTSSENSEMAIRAMCRKVDITGVETVEIKRISEGGRFRSYVLVALPMGDANILQKAKIDNRIREQSASRSTEAFKELDKQ